MWLTRLTSHLSLATRLAGCLAPRCAATSHRTLFACYSSQHPQRQHIPPPTWITLEPELDELLVPRRMSISPLESLLSSRYSLPKHLTSNAQQEQEEHEKCYDCPTSHDTDYIGEDDGDRGVVQCKNVLKIRRRKINKHKYKKLQKRIKFLRKKVLDKRRVRKQKNFEKDLNRIWRKAGLKKAPDSWITPKIYVKY
ncbi:aurora kinase A-interacting protein [Bufo bufo]|uniref:aurora kinase A-interacting protein n=1 Tax=Bufo bufo TaxID=8384 RepID=UPI001ABDF206|nr:aurora kinase A-interacting protein [Bufo bufo]XP_040283871.1 aurora kinase A-interacting protein [Bufo bufo]